MRMLWLIFMTAWTLAGSIDFCSMAPRQHTRWTATQIARIKPLVFLACLGPLARWIWLGFNAGLSANPAQFLILSSGIWALVMLMITLCITPVRRLIKQPALIGLRRMLGQFSFFYTVLHVAGWALWEHGVSLSSMWQDTLDRTFIMIGVLATLPLVALSLTSTRGWMRRLGPHWQRLHRSIYPVAILSIWHFWLVRSGKNDFSEPAIYAVLLGLLLAVRIVLELRQRAVKA